MTEAEIATARRERKWLLRDAEHLNSQSSEGVHIEVLKWRAKELAKIQRRVEKIDESLVSAGVA